MSKREDIINLQRMYSAKYGLIYTEVLGWIDLGHASGDDIRRLLAQMELGENKPDEFYPVRYEQNMFIKKRFVGTSKFAIWHVRRGRSLSERFSIALSMMISIGMTFERMQATWPFNWLTDSGFSGEDLVSDLLGFYRVCRPMNYFSLIQPVSQSEAYRRWDHYGPIGRYKNYGFRPLLFPDPTINPDSKPYVSSLPALMTSILPFNDFKSGNVRIEKKEGTGIFLNGIAAYVERK